LEEDKKEEKDSEKIEVPVKRRSSSLRKNKAKATPEGVKSMIKMYGKGRGRITKK
jgi:hypothetical protein